MNTGLICLVIGIICLGISAKLYSDTLAFLSKATSTRGIVIDLEERTSTNSDGNYTITYYAVVEFIDSRGYAMQFTSKNGRNPPGFRRGQPVKVLYEPENPEFARIGTFGELWLFTILLAVFGVGFSLFGVYSLTKHS